MVEFYVLQVKMGKIVPDKVPLLWREKVMEALNYNNGGDSDE